MAPIEETRLLNHLTAAVMVVDNQLMVQLANQACEQLFGLSRRRLTEIRLTDCVSRIGLEPAQLQHSLASHQGSAFYAMSLITLDGQHHTVDLFLTPMQDGQGLLELRVIDQQQRISQELHQYAQHHAAQLLVRGLAHEIKNPLGGLRGAAQLLERQLTEPGQKEFTGIIIEQADRLRMLVDRLLGPQKPGPRVVANIHRVLEQVSQLCALEFPDTLVFVRDYDPSIPDFDMERDLLQQAVLNIVRNAAQAMEGRGTITLKTRTCSQVTIAGKRHRMAVMVSIIDNGPGIDDKLKDTLFYPMVTGKADGSGLGLSIAQNAVAQHQGRIDVDSWPGHTAFTLMLPLMTTKESQ